MIDVKQLLADADQLKHSQPWFNMVVHVCNAVSELVEENRKLREILRSFVGNWEIRDDLPDERAGEIVVTLGDLRRAAEALKGGEK